MKRNTNVIYEDTFIPIGASGLFAANDFVNFCKIFKFIKIFKTADMTDVICENLVKEEITVCKAPCVYGKYSYALFKAVI